MNATDTAARVEHEAEVAAAAAQADEQAAQLASNKPYLNAIPHLARAHQALREAMLSVIFEGETSTELLLRMYQAELRVAVALGQAAQDTEEYMRERINALRYEIQAAQETQGAAEGAEAPPADGAADTEQPPPNPEQADDQEAQ